VTWPELARSADGALPVLILDGFDELVQATGITQSDYLEKVAAFQRREAEQQRPTAVIVTRRTTVADRARSVSGMLAIWNEVNTDLLAGRDLKPLPAVDARSSGIGADGGTGSPSGYRRLSNPGRNV
jgi:hypothetical protein